ncbi:hypothetical protein R3398_03780 [Rossellomorea marisflavi]|uniref:hypothetical protein n=1 Tax=Rossellomorea marisflavi TaxID=189381 RepID=UPI0025B18DFF|nr:hypothetical protein [Rossellomorea marisflavi]MDW4525490.1 hypothetical protein [Rossellomorea marisflavi]WJV18069.1 hypothetical protein QU593_18345 [Rossellomorea marisflavi]
MSVSFQRLVPIFLMAFVLTLAAIWMNAPGFMTGYSATAFDLMVSVIFFLGWLLISLAPGIKGERSFLVCAGGYWGLGLVVSVFGIFAPYDELLLFRIWFDGPAHGLGLLMGHGTLLKLAVPIVGLGVTLMGYGAGRTFRQKELAEV